MAFQEFKNNNNLELSNKKYVTSKISKFDKVEPESHDSFV